MDVLHDTILGIRKHGGDHTAEEVMLWISGELGHTYPVSEVAQALDELCRRGHARKNGTGDDATYRWGSAAAER